MSGQRPSGYRILPVRDHNDMILQAKFAVPDFKDTDKVLTRLQINLLYYQTNYFLFFIIWPYLAGLVILLFLELSIFLATEIAILYIFSACKILLFLSIRIPDELFNRYS